MAENEGKKDFLDELAQNLMLVALVIAALCSLCGFVFQFFSESTQTLFTQLSYYAYGWMVFLALGPTVKRAAFMKVDVLVNSLYPERVKKVLNVICEVIMFILIAILFVYSVSNLVTAIAEGSVNETAPVIPLAVIYLASVVGYGLAVINYIIRVVKGGNKA